MPSPFSSRSVRLQIEPLESRELPATALTTAIVAPAASFLTVAPAVAPATSSNAIAENFDHTAPGKLPDAWSGWTSDSSAGFAASSARALSPGQGLADQAARSNHAARAWANAVLPADVQTSAAIYLDSLNPALVLARGSALGTTTPTYYAASVSRGLQVQLLAVVGGKAQTLATLQSNGYVSSQWVRLTLTTVGTQVQAAVERLDTNQWLSATGGWQSDQTVALTVQNAAVGGPGQVGVARAPAYTGPVVFDDFTATPTTGNHSPSVSIELPNNGSTTLSGTVPVLATATATAGINRVEFWLDGSRRATLTTAPYTWSLDTTSLADGGHTLTVKAYDPAGNVGSATQTFTVNNHTSLPAIPQHYPWIRIAALAYSGTPMGATEQQLVRNSVDLVIANASFMNLVKQTSPATPQLTYTNLSNLYGSLLTNWLNFAAAQHINPESAFYHVTQPTAFTGNSPSSQPVDWFWNVARGPTSGTGLVNFTSQSHGDGSGTAFGAAGQALSIGYTDPYNQIDFSLASGAGAGWSGALQYASAVDSAGNPNAWTTLKLKYDGTAGFHQSGQVQFDPPADWKAATLPGYAGRLYYVRVVTSSGSASAAPVASTILAADYVNAHGGSSGTIPVFDASADKDHDGYLNDAEYATRKPGDDARFAYQSRLFYPYYGQMRFVINPSGAGVDNWAAAYAASVLAANPLASGLFIDNSSGKLPIAGISVAEATATYASDYAKLLAAVNRSVAPKWSLANIAGGWTDSTTVVPQVAGTLEEFALRPLSTNWAGFQDMAKLVATLQSAASPTPYLVLDSLPAGGSPTDPRTQIATLAYYYLLGNPKTTFLMFYGGYNPSSDWSQHWSPAAAFNVGQPQDAWSTFASGQDPANPALTYQVLQRHYSNALILYKPLSYASGRGTGTLANATATTMSLGGNYRALNADGTLGPIINRVSLRNGEGAILIKA